MLGIKNFVYLSVPEYFSAAEAIIREICGSGSLLENKVQKISLKKLSNLVHSTIGCFKIPT